MDKVHHQQKDENITFSYCVSGGLVIGYSSAASTYTIWNLATGSIRNMSSLISFDKVFCDNGTIVLSWNGIEIASFSKPLKNVQRMTKLTTPEVNELFTTPAEAVQRFGWKDSFHRFYIWHEIFGFLLITNSKSSHHDHQKYEQMISLKNNFVLERCFSNGEVQILKTVVILKAEEMAEADGISRFRSVQ